MKKLPKLERYNQIVWAVVGTGVVLTATVAVLAISAVALYSLLKPDRGAVPVALVEEDTPNGPRRTAARYDFCQPVAVHGSPYQLIRVMSDRFVVRNKPAVLRSRKYDGYSSEGPSYGGCGIYGSDRPSAVVNVLVRQADNGTMHLLLKENAVIHTLEYPQPPVKRTYQADSSFPPPGVLYWEISFEDSNGDNVIDERDDQGAYLSDPDGRNIVRITPTPSRVLEKTYDRKRNRLILRIVRDTNNDKTLDDKDTPSLIEVNVAQRKLVREVLDATRLTEFMRQAEPKRQPPQTP
jgi:hypothetical protein